MNEDLQKMILENNKLIHELAENQRKNQKKINSIHSTLRRNFIARVVYYVLLFLLAAGAFVAVQPYLQDVYDSYQAIMIQVNSTNEAFQNPALLFDAENGIFNLFSSQ